MSPVQVSILISLCVCSVVLGVTAIAGLVRLHASGRSSYIVQTFTSILLIYRVLVIIFHQIPQYFDQTGQINSNIKLEGVLAYIDWAVWYQLLFNYALFACYRFLATYRRFLYFKSCKKGKVLKILCFTMGLTILFTIWPLAFLQDNIPPNFHIHLISNGIQNETIFYIWSAPNNTTSTIFTTLIDNIQIYTSLTIFIIFTITVFLLYSITVPKLKRKISRTYPISMAVQAFTITSINRDQKSEYSRYQHYFRLTIRFTLTTTMFTISTLLAFIIQFTPIPDNQLMKEMLIIFYVISSLFDSFTLIIFHTHLREELANIYQSLKEICKRQDENLVMELANWDKVEPVGKDECLEVKWRYHP